MDPILEYLASYISSKMTETKNEHLLHLTPLGIFPDYTVSTMLKRTELPSFDEKFRKQFKSMGGTINSLEILFKTGQCDVTLGFSVPSRFKRYQWEISLDEKIRERYEREMSINVSNIADSVNRDDSVAAAPDRKETAKKEATDKKQKAADDAFWVDDDKLANRKLQRKDEVEQKKLETLKRKGENKLLAETEMASISGKPAASSKKVTKTEVDILYEAIKRKDQEIYQLKTELTTLMKMMYEGVARNESIRAGAQQFNMDPNTPREIENRLKIVSNPMHAPPMGLSMPQVAPDAGSSTSGQGITVDMLQQVINLDMGRSGASAAPAPARATVVPADPLAGLRSLYAAELQELSRYGYNDDAHILKVLYSVAGNVESALHLLKVTEDE